MSATPIVIRTLTRTPRTLPLYARAAARALPGSGLFPLAGGRGGEIPELCLALHGVQVNPGKLAAYEAVCGFAPGGRLPATYPHVLAFPLHMTVMTHREFPFGPVGLVHIDERIQVRRAIAADEPLDLTVHASKMRAHAKGASFAIVTEARAAGELVWEEQSTMLHREPGAASSADRSAGMPVPELAEGAEWHLPGSLGRRYAAVSGDRNPIHLYALTAKAFGFPRTILHGMCTFARCLAELEPTLPPAYGVQVSFRRPVMLPANVSFWSGRAQGVTHFAVRSRSEAMLEHLQGTAVAR